MRTHATSGIECFAVWALLPTMRSTTLCSCTRRAFLLLGGTRVAAGSARIVDPDPTVRRVRRSSGDSWYLKLSVD